MHFIKHMHFPADHYFFTVNKAGNHKEMNLMYQFNMVYSLDKRFSTGGEFPARGEFLIIN